MLDQPRASGLAAFPDCSRPQAHPPLSSQRLLRYCARKRQRMTAPQKLAPTHFCLHAALRRPGCTQITDLRQLSGGERSYVTVSFLLAVGKHTESPFRCMDEFDVFMDAVNRRTATETLLEFANENRILQNVFLTPQDIQAVEDARRHLEERLRAMNKSLPPSFLKVVQMQPARHGRAQQQQQQQRRE
eukprot:354314-Chlamydomonas_euryale.AAC.23